MTKNFSDKILLTFTQGPYSSRAPFSVIGEMDLGPVHGPEGNFFCAIALRLLPSLSNVLGKFMIYESVFYLWRFVCLYVFLCLSACLSFKMYLKSSWSVCLSKCKYGIKWLSYWMYIIWLTIKQDTKPVFDVIYWIKTCICGLFSSFKWRITICFWWQKYHL